MLLINVNIQCDYCVTVSVRQKNSGKGSVINKYQNADGMIIVTIRYKNSGKGGVVKCR